MSFRLDAPKHDAAKGCYIFSFQDPPVFDCSSVVTVPFEVEPALQAQLAQFSDQFLTMAAKFFSKKLPAGLFFQRLQHIWHKEVAGELQARKVLRATWIPDAIHFYTNRYELHWMLTDVEYEPDPTIPPGFLEREFGEELEGGGLELPEAALGTLEDADVEEIPFSGPSEGEKAAKAKERQRIRQARLRVALAQLRAERLAERYYQRYGTFEGVEGSDSELSSDEEGGAPGALQ